MNVIDYGMDPAAAVDAPRFHHQWLPDVVYAEPHAFSPNTEQRLRQMGYTLKQQARWGAGEVLVGGPAAGTMRARSPGIFRTSLSFEPGVL